MDFQEVVILACVGFREFAIFALRGLQGILVKESEQIVIRDYDLQGVIFHSKDQQDFVIELAYESLNIITEGP